MCVVSWLEQAEVCTEFRQQTFSFEGFDFTEKRRA